MAAGDGIIIFDERPEDDDENAAWNGKIISGQRQVYEYQQKAQRR
jgi:hypothetical protein